MKCLLTINNICQGLVSYTPDILKKEQNNPGSVVWLLPDSYNFPVNPVTKNSVSDPRPFPNDVALEAIRTKRDLLLAETDWVVCADVSLSQSVKDAYLDYRQQLRDLPQTYASNPNDVVWPTKP
jgi:hypothetical protein